MSRLHLQEGARAQERHRPAVRRDRIVRDGLATHYLAGGNRDSPPVVLLHDGGWGASAEASWSGVIPVLAEHFHVIAPDLYGYGESSKMVQFDVAPYEFRLRQVGQLLDALGLQGRRVYLIGNSFGGAMAVRAATLPWFSWRLAGVVSIAGTGGPHRTKEGLAALSQFDGSTEDMRRITKLITDPFPGFDEHVELRMRNAASPGHYRAVAAATLATPCDAERSDRDEYPANLSTVTTPVAFVSGLRDTLLEPGWAHQIAAHGPTCEVHEIDEKHSPNIYRPAEIGGLVLDICQRMGGN